MQLAQWPTGCAGCGGACCKSYATPPWIAPEVARFNDLLGPDMAAAELARLNRGPTRSACWHLTDDALCGLQLAGFQKPHACVAFHVGGPDCLNERRKHGVGN